MASPRFHSELYARTYRSNKWMLVRELVYTTLLTHQPTAIKVRKGFISDLASIPKWARSFISVNDRHRRPAVVHDWLYSLESDHDWNRRKCDKIFLEAMIATGVKSWKRKIMYRAVRIGAGNRGRFKKEA